MKHEEKEDMAKKIAVLLAEKVATIDDMFDIFQMVRENLVVCPKNARKNYLHGIYIANQTRDDDGIRDE